MSDNTHKMVYICISVHIDVALESVKCVCCATMLEQVRSSGVKQHFVLVFGCSTERNGKTINS